MNKRLLSIVGLPLFLAACGGSLGRILVDGSGKTLYLFEADTGSTSTCTASCAQAWPPLTTKGAPQAAGGASASLLGTTCAVTARHK
jgi:predicted lipoprotein with Yx(FWY)xxD motif